MAMNDTQRAAVAAIEKEMDGAQRGAFNAGMILRQLCRHSAEDAERILTGFGEGKDLRSAAREIRHSSADGGLTAVELEEVLRRFYGLNERLAEPEDVEPWWGMAVHLPAQIGQRVWIIQEHTMGKPTVEPRRVYTIEIWADGMMLGLGIDGRERTFTMLPETQIGRRIFFAREDAESALRGGGEDG